MSTFTSYEVGEYLGLGVSPWLTGKIVREFRQHGVRLELLGTALLVESENPGVPPARLWKSVIRQWLRECVRLSLGMTGRGAESADRRSFACVDGSADLSQVAAAATDDAIRWQAEQEQSRIVSLVVVLLGDLGKALESGSTMEQAATACGCSLATAYRKVDRVREMLTSEAA